MQEYLQKDENSNNTFNRENIQVESEGEPLLLPDD
jgi:hypothetical protein